MNCVIFQHVSHVRGINEGIIDGNDLDVLS
jgi:hypothetical protein